VNGIIDADGLFNGDRFEQVSDAARYAWPYLWLASNTFGRLELNYHRIAGRAFSRFKHVPTEEDFWSWVEEFQAAYLLFVYEVNGTLWGQWATSEKFLPRHKLTIDQRSPVPDHAAFSAWRDQYITEKQARNSAKPIAATNFRNTSEGFPKSSGNSSEKLPRRVGEGVGVGENICASDNARAGDSLPSSDEPQFDVEAAALFQIRQTNSHKKPAALLNGHLAAQQDAWFDEWWAIYWLKKAKKPACDAFRKHVKTETRFQEVMAATRAQAPEMLSREAGKRPHGATWLNGERWADEIEQPRQQAPRASDDWPEFRQ
jgi:hypothetical protein